MPSRVAVAPCWVDGIHDAPSHELIVTGLRQLARATMQPSLEAPEQLASIIRRMLRSAETR